MFIGQRCPCHIFRLSSSFNHAILIVAVNGVCCIVTTSIELVNNNRCTTSFLDIHNDMAKDGTALIVTTEHLAILSASDGQLHIAFDVSVHRTAIDILCPGFTTTHHHDQVTLDVGILTSAIQILNSQ